MTRFLFVFAILWILGVSLPASAQFYVVSIHPYVSQGDPANERSALDFPPGGRFLGTNVTVRKLVRVAFGVENNRILGTPGWADTLTYNIEAKTAGGVEVTRENLPALLLPLLTSRFGLQFHRDTRQASEYDLEVAKDGFKLQPDTGDAKSRMSENSNGASSMMSATKLPLNALAAALARYLERPVVDKTGIAGDYNFHLKWSSDQALDPVNPSIFAALQEIGLRLVSTKGPVEVISVDRVEEPSEN
ncbi:MAG TPA: TIGR03435 family protein [Bryobacteraceae bacterium]|nr:TIGR03435 family protein [Bryobacteraceae bacterium]